MRKTLPLVMIMFLVLSCGNDKKVLKNNFSRIDFTYSSGGQGGYSIIVDSIGQYVVFSPLAKGRTSYNTGKLSGEKLSTLSFFADSILVHKSDTSYLSNCYDCPHYYLIIDGGDRNYQTNIDGHGKPKYVDSIIALFHSIVKEGGGESDTSLTFVSLNKLLPALKKDSTTFTLPTGH